MKKERPGQTAGAFWAVGMGESGIKVVLNRIARHKLIPDAVGQNGWMEEIKGKE